MITKYNFRSYFRFQHNSFQCTTTAERHIHLSASKRFTCIYNHAIESKSLAFMYCNSPGQTYRILLKTTQYFFLNILFFVQRIFFLFPGFFRQRYFLFRTIQHCFYNIFIDIGNLSKFTVIKFLLRRSVIPDKHNLSSHLQLQNFFIGKLAFAKASYNSCFVEFGFTA